MEYACVWDFFDQIYCISVEQRRDRRRTARREFVRVGLLERVEFVLVARHALNPEQGIYESHQLCMRQGLAAGAETILIFEDDILFHGFDEEAVIQACQGLQEFPDWNAFFLGCIVRRLRKTPTRSLVRIRYQCLTHGYAVRRAFARRLVNIPWQGIPYDGLLKAENSHFFGLHPMIAFQSNSATDNQTVQIDRVRRLFGGLQRVQRLNELFHTHKKGIILSHGVVLALAVLALWSWRLNG